MCVSLNVCMCVPGALEGHFHGIGSPGTEDTFMLWIAMWVLGTKSRSCVKIISIFNFQAISPCPDRPLKLAVRCTPVIPAAIPAIGRWEGRKEVRSPSVSSLLVLCAEFWYTSISSLSGLTQLTSWALSVCLWAKKVPRENSACRSLFLFSP